MKRTGYRDRQHAGEVLAEILLPYREKKPVVLAVPRGGIPVALPIVFALNCDFDLIIARKIADPRQPELAIGAVGEDGPVLLNNRLVRYFNLSPEDVETIKAEKNREIKSRLQAYRGKKPRVEIEGRTVIVVDDGVATGFTVTAALRSVKNRSPKELILAVPVAPPGTVAALSREADKVVCPLQPKNFAAVGQFYENFAQVSEGEVKDLLARLGMGK